MRQRLRRHLVGPAALVVLALAASPPAEAIVGGDAAPAGRWPWMVAVLDAADPDAASAQFCGGVVIAPRRVLTAGHCVMDEATENIDVLVGRTRLTETQGRRLAVAAISVFPGFVNEEQPGLDAAVLTLTADAGVPPLPLARPGQEAAWAPGTPAWTMGWGALNARLSPGGSRFYADRLHELQVPVQGDDACESAFGLGWGNFPYRPAWLLCAGTAAGDTGPCVGDSGGPLVVGSPGAWLDVGVLSGGDSCAARGYFDLWARVDRVSRFALSAALPRQPDPLALPRVVGRPRAGARVRCVLGRWRGSPTHFSVRWRRLGPSPAAVPGRARTHRLSSRDARSGVECSVTATSRGGRMTVVSPPLRPPPR
jgi:secreted trypsin-like serine protease